MGIIARDDRQVTLIFSSNTREGKWTLSYLQGIDRPHLAIDLAKTKVSDTQWVEIAHALGVKVGDLVDKRELEMKADSTEEFGTHDWLKIIQNNDAVISKPIVIKGKITKQLDNAPEIMEFFEVDSAGLEQSPSKDNTMDIERTTDDENFIEKKE